MKKPEVDEIWLPKDEAAALLKVGIRQLENRAADGQIRKATLPKLPSERVARVVFSRADVLALLNGTPRTPGNREETREGKAAAHAQIAAQTAPEARGVVAIPAALIDALRERREPREVLKPWLTLSEAVQYSGLPASWLIAAARDGAPIAINTGKGRRREYWRFNRDAIALAGIHVFGRNT
jgi:hypothetical protein